MAATWNGVKAIKSIREREENERGEREREREERGERVRERNNGRGNLTNNCRRKKIMSQ
jgi:hypothetical protein